MFGLIPNDDEPRRNKRPGQSEDDDNPQPKRPSRYTELYLQLESPDFSDSYIVAWDKGNKVKLNVHKVMIVAASKVLKTQFGDFWKNPAEPQAIVDLPKDYSLEAAKAFIKLLYVDTLDPDISLDTALEIAYICDMLIIECAIDTCNQLVMEKITTETCITIMESYEQLQTGNCSAVYKKALEFMTGKLNTLLDDSANWTLSVWNSVLKMESPEVAEIDELKIFKKLISWRDVNPKQRNSPFEKELLPLVRFPLMSRIVLVEEVVPTEVLSDEDIADLLCYSLQKGGKGAVGRRKPRFNRFSRTVKVVSTLEEISEICKLNDNFLLNPTGTFTGPFSLVCDKIKITGMGSATKIICDGKRKKQHTDDEHILEFETNDSEISNIEIQCKCNITITPTDDEDDNSASVRVKGSRNLLTNLSVNSVELTLKGNFNEVSYSSFSRGDCGIFLEEGTENVFRNLTISLTKYGFNSWEKITGNTMEQITLTDVLYGFLLQDANDNELTGITYEFSGKRYKKIVAPKAGFFPYIIKIVGGSNNEMSKITGYPIKDCKKRDEKAGIRINGPGKSNKMSNINLSSFRWGVYVSEENTGNSLENLKTKDTNFPIVVLSDDNFGSNARCKYSKISVEAWRKHKAQFGCLLTIREGSNNTFDGVELVVADVPEEGVVAGAAEARNVPVEENQDMDEQESPDNVEGDKGKKEKEQYFVARIVKKQDSDKIPRNNEIFVKEKGPFEIEGEDNNVYFTNE